MADEPAHYDPIDIQRQGRVVSDQFQISFVQTGNTNIKSFKNKMEKKTSLNPVFLLSACNILIPCVCVCVCPLQPPCQCRSLEPRLPAVSRFSLNSPHYHTTYRRPPCAAESALK